MMTPEQALDLLRRDSRNTITAMHRWMDVQSESGSGSGITNVTLNEFEPFYEGWGGFLEFSHHIIDYVLIERIKSHLTAEPWGTQRLGGTIYRLRDSH